VHLLFQRSSIIFFVQRRSKGVRARPRRTRSALECRLERGCFLEMTVRGRIVLPGSLPPRRGRTCWIYCNLSLIVLDADSSTVTGK
jgi:hypothetical protein